MITFIASLVGVVYPILCWISVPFSIPFATIALFLGGYAGITYFLSSTPSSIALYEFYAGLAIFVTSPI